MNAPKCVSFFLNGRDMCQRIVRQSRSSIRVFGVIADRHHVGVQQGVGHRGGGSGGLSSYAPFSSPFSVSYRQDYQYKTVFGDGVEGGKRVISCRWPYLPRRAG